MSHADTEALDLPALDVLAIAAHPDDIEQTCGGTCSGWPGKGIAPGRWS